MIGRALLLLLALMFTAPAGAGPLVRTHPFAAGLSNRAPDALTVMQ